MTQPQNPLVATADQPDGAFTNFDDVNKGFTGAGIFGNASQTVADATSGKASTFTLAVDGVTNGLDLLGMAMDPLGSLASAGVGWLIEHISFLHEALDKLAGDPDAVTAKAQTWKNVSQSLQQTAEGYQQSAAKLEATWPSSAGQAYQASASGFCKTVQGAAGHASSAGTTMTVAAALVGAERGLIRDMISGFVGELIVKALAALATSWCSFGGSVAALIADTVIEATALAGKITSRIGKLVGKLGKLAKEFGDSAGKLARMGQALEKAAAKLDRAAATIGRAGGKAAGKVKQFGRGANDAGKGFEQYENFMKNTVDRVHSGTYDAIKNHVTGGEGTNLNNYRPSNFHPQWNTADTVKAGSGVAGGASGEIGATGDAQQNWDKAHPGGISAANAQAKPYESTPSMRPAEDWPDADPDA